MLLRALRGSLRRDLRGVSYLVWGSLVPFRGVQVLEIRAE